MKYAFLMFIILASVLTHSKDDGAFNALVSYKVYSSDGKGARSTEVKLKRQRTLSENLEENLLALHPDLAWAKTHPKEEPKYRKPNFQFHRIGMWRSYEIWDVDDVSNKTYNIVFKISPDEFRLIYSLQPVDLTVSADVKATVLLDSKDESGILKEIKVYRDENYKHLISLDREKSPVVTDLRHSTKNIIDGQCIVGGTRIVFSDRTRKEFPIDKGYECRDFKISQDRQYAGWKVLGEIKVESGGQIQKFPNAFLTVLIGDKTYSAVESSRYIESWNFVPDKSQIVAETAFEHGPSTYVIFDLQEKKMIESCGAFELSRCTNLNLLIKPEQ